MVGKVPFGLSHVTKLIVSREFFSSEVGAPGMNNLQSAGIMLPIGARRPGELGARRQGELLTAGYGFVVSDIPALKALLGKKQKIKIINKEIKS